MSHSNAEKLMIKKEFGFFFFPLCIIPHLRLLSTPSLQAPPRVPVMPEPQKKGGKEPKVLFPRLIPAVSGIPGPCAIPAPVAGCRLSTCSAGL